MLDELGGIIQQQGGLSYTLSNLQSQFQQQFPGYTVPSNPDQQEAKNIATTLNTLNGTLAAAQSQAQNFANEQAQFGELEGMNKTAAGNLQAIEVGNEIALQQVQQIQMLRQLVVAMINAQNVVAANAVNRARGRRRQHPTVAQRGTDYTVLINHAEQRSQRPCPIDGRPPMKGLKFCVLARFPFPRSLQRQIRRHQCSACRPPISERRRKLWRPVLERPTSEKNRALGQSARLLPAARSQVLDQLSAGTGSSCASSSVLDDYAR